MPGLFDPLTLRGVTLRNRIGVSPMCQYCSEDGSATDWHLVHLGSRAVGGAGLIIVEATAVEPRGRISPTDAGLWDDKHIEPLARIAGFLKQHGATPGIQLAHSGRKGSTRQPWLSSAQGRNVSDAEGGWAVVGPSPIAFADGDRVPHELTVGEISEITALFVAAAQRAISAGFDWLELHCAHGYLLHSFLSPISNQRSDQYGGSLENRMRLPAEVATALRKVWPADRPMSVRISCTDWMEGGWSIDDAVELAKRFKAVGVDLIDCSSGGTSINAKVPAAASYQVPLAEAVRRRAEIPTAAVGLITEPMQADEIVRNGRANLVLLGRESLRSPYWPIEAARVLRKTDRIRLPDQYDYAVR